MKKKHINYFVRMCLAIILLWLLMFSVDYRQTTQNLKKPVFAILNNGADDGGSGTYNGLGYSIYLEGNFMPEDEMSGVTYAKITVFGVKLKEVVCK